MTTFILLAALMAAVAIAFVAWPIFRARRADGAGASATGTAVVVALAIPLAAFLLYRSWSNWDWNADPQAAAPQGHEMAAAVQALEQKLAGGGTDPQEWMLLGRSYAVMNEFGKSAAAYRKAYDLTGGKEAEPMLGYAEALSMTDENALGGEAGALIESALKLEPQNPKALWYGGLVALRKDDVATARDRWAALSALNPPPEVKAILDQRIAEMDQKLGRAPQAPAAAAMGGGPAMAGAMGGSGETAAAAVGAGAVTVRLKLAPALAAQVPPGAPLFVLARDPTNPGPPLAAKRLQGVQFPLELVLSDADAMAAGRTISTAKTLTLVARFSKSGMPMASSGDLYGEVGYDPVKDKGKAVEITIDRTVP